MPVCCCDLDTVCTTPGALNIQGGNYLWKVHSVPDILLSSFKSIHLNYNSKYASIHFVKDEADSEGLRNLPSITQKEREAPLESWSVAQMLAHLIQLTHFQKVPWLFLPFPGRKMEPEFSTHLPHLLSSTCSFTGLHTRTHAHPLLSFTCIETAPESYPQDILYRGLFSQFSQFLLNMSFLSYRKPVVP